MQQKLSQAEVKVEKIQGKKGAGGHRTMVALTADNADGMFRHIWKGMEEQCKEQGTVMHPLERSNPPSTVKAPQLTQMQVMLQRCQQEMGKLRLEEEERKKKEDQEKRDKEEEDKNKQEEAEHERREKEEQEKKDKENEDLRKKDQDADEVNRQQEDQKMQELEAASRDKWIQETANLRKLAEKKKIDAGQDILKANRQEKETREKELSLQKNAKRRKMNIIRILKK